MPTMFELHVDVAQILEEAGFELYANYSGRGMYGRKCFGIITSNPAKSTMDLVITLLDSQYSDIEYIRDLVSVMQQTVRQDALGDEFIVYFEGVCYNPERVLPAVLEALAAETRVNT